jgi:hypothetical protein
VNLGHALVEYFVITRRGFLRMLLYFVIREFIVHDTDMIVLNATRMAIKTKYISEALDFFVTITVI